MSKVDLAELLHRIGLRSSHEAIHALIAHATKSKLAPSQLLEQLADIEQRERDARNLARRVTAASIGTPKSLDQYDWNYPAAIDRSLYEHHYQTLDYLKQGENILFRGPAGVGKTTLAQHYGLRALECGYTVCFCTLSTARTYSLPPVVTPIGSRDKGGARDASETASATLRKAESSIRQRRYVS